MSEAPEIAAIKAGEIIRTIEVD